MTVEQIKAWLLSKGVTLWASWDLSQPERLHEAAVWFLAQTQELSDFRCKQTPEFQAFSGWDVV